MLALVDLDEAGHGLEVAAEIEGGRRHALSPSPPMSADAEQVRGGVAHVMEQWGRIDVLMTAAGVSLGGTVDTVDEATWDRTFDDQRQGHLSLDPSCHPADDC